MKTLIVIDAQNDFKPGGSLAVPNGDKIIPVINRIQHKFDLVVAAQDWHPKDHVSFASNHSGKNVFDEIKIHGQSQTLWPDHCVQDTTGALFHADLQTARWEAVFGKETIPATEIYRAFYVKGQRKSLGLTVYLREKEPCKFFFSALRAIFFVFFP